MAHSWGEKSILESFIRYEWITDLSISKFYSVTTSLWSLLRWPGFRNHGYVQEPINHKQGTSILKCSLQLLTHRVTFQVTHRGGVSFENRNQAVPNHFLLQHRTWLFVAWLRPSLRDGSNKILVTYWFLSTFFLLSSFFFFLLSSFFSSFFLFAAYLRIQKGILFDPCP